MKEETKEEEIKREKKKKEKEINTYNKRRDTKKASVL